MLLLLLSLLDAAAVIVFVAVIVVVVGDVLSRCREHVLFLFLVLPLPSPLLSPTVKNRASRNDQHIVDSTDYRT